MQCVANVHYEVIRESTARYWQEPNDYGPIKMLKCKFCHFEVLKRRTGKPKSSKSGLGRYNRMRGQMVKHLHEKHREALAETLQQERLALVLADEDRAEVAEGMREVDDDKVE